MAGFGVFRAVLAAIVLGLGAVAAQGEERIELQSGGLTLGARLVLAEGGSLADGVVLLTHGTMGHYGMETISAQQDALAERGINTLAITLSLGIDRRTGFYDCATPARHRHQDALAEIGLWLEWLKGQGAGKIALMGHSRGGNQTAWFAAENPQAGFEKVILLAPILSDPYTEAASYERRFGVPLAEALEQARALVKAGRGDEMMRVPGFLFCRDAQVSAAAFVSYYEPEPRRNTATLLPRIAQPVLVIGGTADNVVPNLEQVIGPMADGEKIVLRMIEDSDHAFLDFFAEDAADAVAEFLSQ